MSAEGGAVGLAVDLATDEAGNALAAWASSTTYTGSARIEVAVRRAGEGFSDPAVVSPASTRAFGPTVAIDRLGDLAVSWNELPGPNEPRGVPVAFGSL